MCSSPREYIFSPPRQIVEVNVTFLHCKVTFIDFTKVLTKFYNKVNEKTVDFVKINK